MILLARTKLVGLYEMLFNLIDSSWRFLISVDSITSNTKLFEIFKAADRIDQCSVRKAGGGWWMISNDDKKALLKSIANARGAA